MKTRTLITAAFAAIAFSMSGLVSAHDGEAETFTRNFGVAIPKTQAGR